MLTLKQFTETIDRLEEARILMAALEFKIFSILRQKKMTARQMAQHTKTKLDGMEPLLNALTSMQALRYDKGRYSSAPHMYKYLCESSPHYQKGTTFLKLEKNDEWARLIDIIRKGRNVSEYEGDDDPGFRHCFTHAMHDRSGPFAQDIARLVTRKPAGRFLDLGAGPGTYSAAILRKDKKARATLLDRSTALKVARELHARSSIWPRIELKPGDLFETAFGENYDTVFYSNILHVYNPEQNKKLFRKMKKALVKGGRVVLVDYFHTLDYSRPYEAALFGVTMLLFTATGKTYSYDETENLLSQTGFHKFRRFPLKEGAGMLVAFKK
ncbi:MAG: methyltransferase [Nitrospina sp.]|nr:MAG: methyltransferase [Nitrospina sp.]